MSLGKYVLIGMVALAGGMVLGTIILTALCA